MKKLIVITRPDFFFGEIDTICSLFEAGLTHLHIRKPVCSRAEYESFLQSIPETYHSRIRIHEYPEITQKWKMGGIHLNSRFPSIPVGYKGKTSRSCHSLEELSSGDPYEYLFLSPIYTSISKQDYKSCFSSKTLKEASEKGLIRENVIALGGMDMDTIQQIHSLNFGGYAVLGAVWGSYSSPFPYKETVRQFEKLQQSIRQQTRYERCK